MANARPALIPPETLLTIDAARTHALLVALQAPAPLLRASSDAVETARLLFVSPLSPVISAALHHVVALATPLGKRALIEAAADVGGIDAAPWSAMRSADLAATVARIAARGDPAAERCIERARVRLARLLPDRIGYELVPRSTTAVVTREAFAGALATLSSSAGAPWIAEDDDGTLHAAVRWHGEGDSEGRVFVDLVTIDAATKRVSIESAEPDRLLVIAEALAKSVLGDAHAFLERPAFTLRPVLEGLHHGALPAPVKRVSVVGCQLVSGAQRFEARADDALSPVADLFPSRGGYVGRATFRFVLEGVDEPVDVYVDLPNRMGLRDVRFRREIRAALTALGILSPGATEDQVGDMAYAPAPDWRWRGVAGAAGLARMKALGLLVVADPAATRGVASEAVRPWGHGVRTFVLHHPVDKGRHYAFADDWTVRARTVGADDRVLYRLDLDALAATLREDLGLDAPAPSELPAGVLDLGVAVGEDASFRVFYVIARPSERERRRVVRLLAKSALPAHALLLVPRGQGLDHTLEVELDTAEQLGIAKVRPKVAAALAGMRAAGALQAAKPGRTRRDRATTLRLTITGVRDRKGTIVRLNGEDVPLPDQTFAFLVHLVAAHLATPGAWRDRRALGIHLTPHVPSRLRTALRDALPKGFELFESARGGFRLSPDVIVEELDWEGLVDHPDERVRKLALAKRRR